MEFSFNHCKYRLFLKKTKLIIIKLLILLIKWGCLLITLAKTPLFTGFLESIDMNSM